MARYKADPKFMETVPGLFEKRILPSETSSRWVPQEPPSLEGEDEIELDFETTGLRWHDGDQPIGIAVGWRGGQRYLPFRHTGGNLAEDTVKRWAQRELRGKKIRGSHIKFDGHVSREWGVDLEAQGNTLSDVGHYVALLDDHRYEFGLEAISQHYLGEGKVKGIDPSKLKYMHAGDVYEYAEQDVRLPRKLADKLLPFIKKEGLEKVLHLEEQVMWPVMEMEKNGAKINEELLDRWIKRSEQDYARLVMKIHRDTGVKLNPKSGEDWSVLFRKLNLSIPLDAKTGQPTFKDDILRRVANPHIQDARRAKILRDLRSKFLVNYKRELRGGIIRYGLHQIRGGDEEGGGAKTGRFSSSSFGTGIIPDGVNIQQVRSVGRQRMAFGYEEDDDSHDDEIYIVRQLFIPQNGLWLSADAEQIEYRLFAHYANSPKILAAYEQDPHVDFHHLVMMMIKPVLASITRKRAKDINFAKIYGAQLKKIAQMLGVSMTEADHFVEVYDRMFPEVPVLLERAMRQARNAGHVHTLLGRRSRFPLSQFLYRALNSVIQGGAADINKMKLVELHRERKRTGFIMRLTVHDEVDGDIPDLDSATMIEEILDRQTSEEWGGPRLRVPILWVVDAGTDWRKCA